jgi:hypothetical protein
MDLLAYVKRIGGYGDAQDDEGVQVEPDWDLAA